MPWNPSQPAIASHSISCRVPSARVYRSTGRSVSSASTSVSLTSNSIAPPAALPGLAVCPAADLHDDRTDAAQRQQVREEQAGRAGPDDPYLGAHGTARTDRARCRRGWPAHQEVSRLLLRAGRGWPAKLDGLRATNLRCA